MNPSAEFKPDNTDFFCNKNMLNTVSHVMEKDVYKIIIADANEPGYTL